MIVPTYNRAHLVTETIDSILSQTFKDFELIVVDNYSIDNTEDVVKSYTDKRIRYSKHQNNGVVAVNRNYGISKAQGDYIAFCDDDDLWMPEKLERQVLEFEGDSQVGLVCTNGINFDKNGEHGEFFPTTLGDSTLTFKSLVWNNSIICSSALVKRQAIDDVGVLDESPEIVTAEDYEFWLRIAKRYKVRYTSLPLVKYRTHPDAYRYNKARPEPIRRSKAVYTRLLDKGVLDSELYQRRINKLRYEALVARLVRLLERAGMLKYVSPVLRLLRRLVHMGHKRY